MNWFRNRKTITKLMIGFGVLAAMLAFVAYQGVSTARGMSSRASLMYERDFKGISAWKEASFDLLYIGRAYRSAILADDKAEIERYRSEIEDAKTKLNTNFAEAEKTIVTAEGKQIAAETKTALSELYAQVAEIMRLAEAGQDKDATARMASARGVANKAVNNLTTLANQKDKLASQANSENAAAYASSRSLLLTIGVIGTLLAIVLGYIIAQMIARPLATAMGLIQGVSKGDLRNKADVKSTDEVGQMLTSINHMVENLRKTVKMSLRGHPTSLAAASSFQRPRNSYRKERRNRRQRPKRARRRWSR